MGHIANMAGILMTRRRQPICFIAGLFLGLFFGYGACYVPAKAAVTGTRVCVSDTGPALLEVGTGYLTHRGGVRLRDGVITRWVELDTEALQAWLPEVRK